MKIAYTVCNRNQLSHALVLAHSLRKHSPGHQFFLGWVDRLKLPQLPDWVSILQIESLEITDWSDMEQRYYDFELVAASKPFFARYLLTIFPDCQELVFLSPATQLFASLDLVSDESAFLQLSPQRLAPIKSTGNHLPTSLDDKRILNTGMYQAGSWIMHPDGQEKTMLTWWCQRMTDRGYFDLCAGMCLDQLWLNYLPIYQERVKTIRNAGWNYGLHAVPGSELTSTDGKYRVDSFPLISLDFAGLESHHPIWSDHAELVKGRTLWADLRQSYQKSLREHEFPSDEAILPYGKAAPIKTNRKYRKWAVRLLAKMTNRIESLDWTYS